KVNKTNSGAKQISFNLNHRQPYDPHTLGELILLQKNIQPLILIVESTEALPLQDVKFLSVVLHHHHIELAIDDVGSDTNVYENVGAALPYVDRIKFALQNFRADHLEKNIGSCLSFWIKQAKKNHLEMILEGIEDPNDQKLA